MSTEPTITLVIPTHNRCELLKETVASVQAQQCRDWELVVVNDCSSDDTREWLDALDDDRVRPIHMEQHQERDFCRNHGLQNARGEFVVFLDDDDLLNEWTLAEHLQSFQQYPDAIASIGGFNVFDEAGSSRVTKVARKVMLREVFEDVLFGFVATGGQCLIRKRSMQAIDGWNEAYRVATDHELWTRLSRQGRVALRPMVALHYRVHVGQWRPPNMEELMTEVREKAVLRLPEDQQPRGRHILMARRYFIEAYAHYLRAETKEALALYQKALGEMPDLFDSPLRKDMAYGPYMKCKLGGAGLRLGRRIVDKVWEWRRRRINITGDLDAANDGRWEDGQGTPAPEDDADDDRSVFLPRPPPARR